MRRAILLLATTLQFSAPAIAEGGTSLEAHLSPYMSALQSITVEAAGRPRRFLFDTGAGITVITPELARELHCAPAGRVSGHRMRGERIDMPRCDRISLKLAGHQLNADTVGVLDLKKLLPAGAEPIDGVLALDVFANARLLLDAGGGTIQVLTQREFSTAVQHAVEVPSRFAREMQGLSVTPYVGVQFDAYRAWFELDTGSDGEIVVAHHVPASSSNTGSTGKSQLRLAIGAVPIEGHAKYEDLLVDGNIGLPIWRQFLIFLDIHSQRIWLRRKAVDR